VNWHGWAVACTSQYVTFTYNGPKTNRFRVEVTGKGKGDWKIQAVPGDTVTIYMNVDGIYSGPSDEEGASIPGFYVYKSETGSITEGSVSLLTATATMDNVYVETGKTCSIYLSMTTCIDSQAAARTMDTQTMEIHTSTAVTCSG